MTINWFPGHMHKTQKALREQMKHTDLVIEILDARAPLASRNPLLADIQRDCPLVVILNKVDLADPDVTAAWQQHFADIKRPVRLMTANTGFAIADFERCIQQQVTGRWTVDKPLRLLVMGLPNVGKSTFLNQWLGRRVHRVGDTPAVTQHIQRIKLKPGWVLFDTPGVMWQKLPDADMGYRLALLNMIKETAFDFADVAAYCVDFLLGSRAAHGFRDHYQLPASITTELPALEWIAQRRGCMRHGQVQWEQVGQLIVKDFRAGAFGVVSLERPDLCLTVGSE